MSPTFQGEVIAFDENVGLGEVRAESGGTYVFHCTQIADGSRTIDVGTPVKFRLIPGRSGRWEAGDIWTRYAPSEPSGAAAGPAPP